MLHLLVILTLCDILKISNIFDFFFSLLIYRAFSFFLCTDLKPQTLQLGNEHSYLVFHFKVRNNYAILVVLLTVLVTSDLDLLTIPFEDFPVISSFSMGNFSSLVEM